MKTIFSGIQPSGVLHIGNYIGALRNWVDLQDEYKNFFCIVDLHAITLPQKPEQLKKATLDIAKMYLAAGIDPKKSSIFIQSHVSAHSELAWIFTTMTKMGEMNRMTQYKDKKEKGEEANNVGLFSYPILMASDILLYDPDLVPVGEDQTQHLEFTKHIARRFNHNFGDTFKIPEQFTKKEGARIMALDDASQKMSKSSDSMYNAIGLRDDADTIAKKIKKAQTDSGSEIVYSDDKPAVKNLLNIYHAFADRSIEEIVAEYEGKGYGDFKKGLTEVVIEGMKPFHEKLAELDKDEAAVMKILEDGAKKARKVADAKMKQVHEKMGFIV